MKNNIKEQKIFSYLDSIINPESSILSKNRKSVDYCEKRQYQNIYKRRDKNDKGKKIINK
ncbi:MAG: hypothetical protein AAB757_01860 [Patescibacteria group bacterium]